jgi:hypothetical protein
MYRACLLLCLAVAPIAAGQAPNDPRARSAAGVQIHAGQLIAELRNVDTAAGRLPAPQQAEVRRQSEQCRVQAAQLQRAIAALQPYPAVVGQFQALDRDVDQLVLRSRAFAPQDAGLQAAVARADMASNRLGAALNFGVGLPGPIAPPVVPPGGGFNDAQRESLRRLARSFDGQAEALYQVARTTLPGDLFGRQLEGQIRQFARSADRIADQFDRPVAVEQIRAQFAPVQAQWSQLAQTLSGVGLSGFPQLRIQAAQVDQSLRVFSAALGMPVAPGGGGPGPAWPNFPIGNHRDVGLIALGAGEGGLPLVRLLLDRRGQSHYDFMAYDEGFTGGVRVAVADVTGDGIVDVITGPGPGAPPLVRVFDGRDCSLVSQFFAYDPRMLSGVWVAAMDITGNGRSEIVTGAGDGGGPHVRIFDAASGRPIREFFAYDQRLNCGARVAVADVNGDRVPDIVTAPGPGAEPLVKVFSGRDLSPVTSLYAYERAFLGGVFIAAADASRNGRAEILTGPGANGGPHVRLFDPMAGRVIGETWPYDRNFLGGVRVALIDADRSRRAFLLVGPGPGGPPLTRVIRAADGQVVSEFMAFDTNFTGGVFVAGN